MADFRDSLLGSVFPTREGVAPGAANERTMLENVGGAAGIRTKILTNPDGSETMLRTRGGMPEFTTKKKKADDSFYDPCQHGLYFGGTDYFDAGENRMRTSGGALELDSGAVLALPGMKPTTGDAYKVGNYWVSGQYARVCGTEWGDFVWPIAFGGTTYLCRHIPGGGDLWIYAFSDKTFTTPLAQLVMPSLPTKLASLQSSTFDNSHGYIGAYFPFLVDMDSTGTKLLFEVHKLRNYIVGGVNDPFTNPDEYNRARLMRPHTLLFAWESVISFDGAFHIANTDLVTYSREQPQATAVVLPTTPALLPIPNYQNHSVTTYASITGSLTINFYPQGGGGPIAYSITAINGTPVASFQPPKVSDNKCFIGGVRYGDGDTIEVAYTYVESWQEITAGYTRSTASYTENGSNDFSTPVFFEQVDNKKRVRQYIGANQLGVDMWSTEHYEFNGFAQGGPPFDMALISDAGAYSYTYGPFTFMVRISNKVFGQALSSDINWTDTNQNVPWATTITLGECKGTLHTKAMTSALFSGTAITYVDIRDTAFGLQYSMTPLVYASERPDASKKIAMAIGKSLCWV